MGSFTEDVDEDKFCVSGRVAEEDIAAAWSCVYEYTQGPLVNDAEARPKVELVVRDRAARVGRLRRYTVTNAFKSTKYPTSVARSSFRAWNRRRESLCLSVSQISSTLWSLQLPSGLSSSGEETITPSPIWKIVLAVNPACRVVAGPRNLPSPVKHEPSMGLSISLGLWTRCAPITLWKVWDLFRERVERVGTEEERFNRLFPAACGCIEAGNEAEGDIGFKKGGRREEEEFDRRIGFGGGVGGVAIQVGVEEGNNTRRDERIGVESPVGVGRGKKVRTDSCLGDRTSALRATFEGSNRESTSVVVESDECGK